MKKEENLPRKWEILFTIPNFNTAGSGKALLNIASRLDSKYFEPHIACLHDKGELFNEVKQSGIPVHVFQFTAHMEKRIAGFIQCWGISRYFKKINPNLIHSFHYAPDYSEALAARMAGVPWIYTKKNMNWGGKSKNGWKLRTRLAHHVICQNRSMLDLFFKDSKKTSMIPRGIDIKEFKMQPPNSDLLTQLGIASNDKVIITVANLAPVKGIELLLESFEILYKKEKNICLLIIGDHNNEYARSLKKKIIYFKSIEKVHFCGWVKDVCKYYSIADIFVLPSKKESCPVALLEAMACGLPVLASDIPGNREILEPFTDFLFPLDSKSTLVEKLFLMLFNNKLLPSNQNRIIDHITMNYYIDIEVQRHEQLYKKLNSSSNIL